MQEPWNLDQLIFDLQVRGFRPVLAHPERYTYYYGKPSRYKELHDAGLMFQINLLRNCWKTVWSTSLVRICITAVMQPL